MGISGLLSFLKHQSFKGALKHGVPKSISHLYLDFPQIIHHSYDIVFPELKTDPDFAKAQQKKSLKELKAEFFETIVSNLSTIIQNINPQNFLFIGFDGFSPTMGKSIQQRYRRYTTVKSNNLYPIVRNMITPGTKLMWEILEYVKKWLIQNHSILPTVVLSPFNEGEAEHSIFDYLRRPEHRPRTGEMTAIMGMDWDLSVLSIINVDIKQIFLIREDISLSIDIDAVREGIKLLLNGANTALNDFALILLSIGGNDFIPRFEFAQDLLGSMNSAINCYIQNNLPLTRNNGSEIIWENMTGYWKLLTVKEKDEFLPEVVSKRYKFSSEIYRKSVKEEVIKLKGVPNTMNNSLVVRKFDYETFRHLWYKQEYEQFGLDSTTLKFLEGDSDKNFILNPSDEIIRDDIDNQVLEFLLVSSWILKYFLKGHRYINYTYYHYYFAPLASDIYSFMTRKADTLKNYEVGWSADEKINSSALIQLPIVIPPQDGKIVLEDMQSLFSDKSLIADMMPWKIKVINDGRNNDYHPTKIIPFPDLDRILEAVSKLILNPENLNFYEEGSDIEIRTSCDNPNTVQLKNNKNVGAERDKKVIDDVTGSEIVVTKLKPPIFMKMMHKVK